MKIDKIIAENFGRFPYLELDIDEGLNILYGENESGKTTIREMVRVLLFGFGARVKSSKRYRFFPWEAVGSDKVLKVECTGVLGDNTPFRVIRTIAANVTGTLIQGDESIDLENDPLPWVSHLSADLFSDVYSLTTDNTYDFQSIDLIQLERRILETWGSGIIKTPDEVVDFLNESVSTIYKPKYNSSTKLRQMDTALSELHDQRTKLIDEKNRYSDVLSSIEDYEELVERQDIIVSEIKNELQKLEAFMPVFIELNRSEVEFEKTIFDDIHGFDGLRANKMFEVGTSIKVIDDELRNTKELSESTADEIYSVWSGLFKSFPRDELFEKASTINFAESIMVAREGRNLKMKLASISGFRIIFGFMLSLLGILGIMSYVFRPEIWDKADSAISSVLLGGFGIIASFCFVTTVDAILKKISYSRRLRVIIKDTNDCFEEFIPPTKAVETFDEEWFGKLSEVEELSKLLMVIKNKERNEELKKESLVLEFVKLSGIQNLNERMDLEEILEELRDYLAREHHIIRKRNDIEIAVRNAEVAVSDTMQNVKTGVLAKYMRETPLDAMENLRSDYDEAMEKLSRYNIELASLKASISNVEIFDELLIVEAKIKEIKDIIHNLKEERDTLMIISEFVALSNQKFIDGKKPNFAGRASQMFKNVTGEKYKGVVIEDEKIFALSDSLIDYSKITSTGTGEQLFMSMKMAVLGDIELKHEALPVSLDNTFAHWDKKRFIRFMNQISEISNERQFLIFTCDEGVLNAIENNYNANIIRLEG